MSTAPPLRPAQRRRHLLLGLAAALAAALPDVMAQAKPGMARIGYLPAGPDTADQTWLNMLRKALGDLGYTEGRNLAIHVGRPDGTPSGMKAAVAQMLAFQPNLVITFGNEPVVAMKRMAPMIPVVMTQASDPQGRGLVGNLSRPGGMVTGSSVGIDAALYAKQLQALRWVLPKLNAVTVLTSGEPWQPAQVKLIERVARPMGIKVLSYRASDREQLAGAFRSAKSHKSAVLVWGDYPQSWMREQIGQFSIDHQVPVVAVNRTYVDAGALMSVGVSPRDQFEIAARYADRILGGSKPGELPIEFPTSTEFIINGKTAARLGLHLSNEVRLRANEVIEESSGPAAH